MPIPIEHRWAESTEGKRRPFNQRLDGANVRPALGWPEAYHPIFQLRQRRLDLLAEMTGGQRRPRTWAIRGTYHEISAAGTAIISPGQTTVSLRQRERAGITQQCSVDPPSYVMPEQVPTSLVATCS